MSWLTCLIVSSARYGVLLASVRPVERRAGLNVDEGDVVRQHVVEFPGDAQPFLAHALAGLGLPHPGLLRGADRAVPDRLADAEKH